MIFKFYVLSMEKQQVLESLWLMFKKKPLSKLSKRISLVSKMNNHQRDQITYSTLVNVFKLEMLSDDALRDRLSPNFKSFFLQSLIGDKNGEKFCKRNSLSTQIQQ